MIKKDYMQPTTNVVKIQHSKMLCISDVKTTGLDNNLTQDETPGNTWDDAMSRRKNDWDDEEEEEW